MANNVVTIVVTSSDPIANTGITNAQVANWAEEVCRLANDANQVRVTGGPTQHPELGTQSQFTVTTATSA